MAGTVEKSRDGAATTVRAKRGKSAATLNHRTVVGRNRRARMRSRIIAAAARVFAERGEAALIDDFIRAAGVSRGTFYNYFRTTGELLEATISSLKDDAIRAVDPQVGRIEDVVMRLATAMRIHLRWAASDPNRCAFIAKMPVVGPMAEQRITRDLKEGLQLKAFRYSDLPAAFDLVVSLPAQAIRRMATETTDPGYPDAVVELVLQGLGVAPRRIREALKPALPTITDYFV